MQVTVVPCLSDNFAYILWDEQEKIGAAVDPVEPQKVLDVAAGLGVDIQIILTTHNHWDHAGGNVEFKKLRPQVKCYGGRGDEAPGVDHEVWEGDEIKLGKLTIKVIATPCHTQGHVCYYVLADRGAVFTGDTMFIAGCGKLNRGNAKMMRDAFDKLEALPLDTLVYVGHEYTVTNLRFAQSIEPDNADIARKLEWAKKQRENNLFTTPSTIEDEKKTSPFVRSNLAHVMALAGTEDPAEGMKFVRAKKDEFK